jgi:hypothetical protein
MSDTRIYPSIPVKTLASDLSSSGTAIVLTDANDWAGTALTTASFNSDYVPVTLINDAKTLVEFMLVNASTISVATTTGLTIYKRGLKYYAEGNSTDIDEVTANKLNWTQGETRVLLGSHQPWMMAQFANRGNDETITGVWTFSGTPVISNSPSGNTDAANKAYVDGVAVAGAPNANTTTKGIVEIATASEIAAGTATGGTGAALVVQCDRFVKTSSGAGDENKIPVLDANGTIAQGFLNSARTIGAVYSAIADNIQITTDADSANDAVRYSLAQSLASTSTSSGTAGETLAAGDLVYLKAADSRLWKSVNSGDESTYKTVGMALGSATAGNSVAYAKLGGLVTGLSGLTAGGRYYVGSSAGTPTTTMPNTRTFPVGIALSTTSLQLIGSSGLKVRAIQQTLEFGTNAASVTGITLGFQPIAIIALSSATAFGTSGMGIWCASGNFASSSSSTGGTDGFILSATGGGTLSKYAVTNVTGTTFDLTLTGGGGGANQTAVVTLLCLGF